MIDTVIENQLRNKSAAEVKRQKREKRIETKIKKVHPNLLQKKAVFLIRQPKQVEQQVTPTIQILMRTHPYGVKQALVKSKILECVRIG